VSPARAVTGRLTDFAGRCSGLATGARSSLETHLWRLSAVSEEHSRSLRIPGSGFPLPNIYKSCLCKGLLTDVVLCSFGAAGRSMQNSFTMTPSIYSPPPSPLASFLYSQWFQVLRYSWEFSGRNCWAVGSSPWAGPDRLS